MHWGWCSASVCERHLLSWQGITFPVAHAESTQWWEFHIQPLNRQRLYPHDGYKGAVVILPLCQCWCEPRSCCFDPFPKVFTFFQQISEICLVLMLKLFFHNSPHYIFICLSINLVVSGSGFSCLYVKMYATFFFMGSEWRPRWF